MTRATEIENKHEYAQLLVEMLPHVIHMEEENDRRVQARQASARSAYRSQSDRHSGTRSASPRSVR